MSKTASEYLVEALEKTGVKRKGPVLVDVVSARQELAMPPGRR
jgi:hypothetical protein